MILLSLHLVCTVSVEKFCQTFFPHWCFYALPTILLILFVLKLKKFYSNGYVSLHSLFSSFCTLFISFWKFLSFIFFYIDFLHSFSFLLLKLPLNICNIFFIMKWFSLMLLNIFSLNFNVFFQLVFHLNNSIAYCQTVYYAFNYIFRIFNFIFSIRFTFMVSIFLLITSICHLISWSYY